MSVIERTSQNAEQQGSRWPRKRWLVPTFAVAALATAAAGYAVREIGNTTEIYCPDGGIDAVTGDPVVDCANEWRHRRGTEPPELIAYDNQHGGIEVVPADAEVPAHWTPLEPGLSQDSRLIELDAALADYGDGLSAHCYSPQDALPIAAATLERLRLDGWTARIDENSVGGDGTCAVHILDPEARQVVIYPLEMTPPPEETDFRLLAAAIQAQVDGQCLSRSEALNTVQRIASELGIDEAAGHLVIHSPLDPSAACSRSDVNVGGRIEVTIRGS